MNIINLIQVEFESRFGKQGNVFFCPGRVNLIGEHIDYNGGLVLPVAISKGIYAVAALNGKAEHSIYSVDFPKSGVTFSLNDFSKVKGTWAGYVAGTFQAIVNAFNIEIPGLDIVFAGDLPKGSGLSSSAAMEVLSGFLAAHFAGINIDRTNLARLCQRTEVEFIGVSCGIMDQYAVANGKADTALLLDCSKVSHRNIAVNWKGYSLVILNTNKPRSLVESKYNERKGECDTALAIFKGKFANLCEAGESDLAEIADPTIYKRARHVITENNRVVSAADALEAGDIVDLGSILKASHHSLRFDYEVSCLELDVLCDFANEHPACMGARLTGAGFGGCAIALVHSGEVDAFSSQIKGHYLSHTGREADVFVCDIVDGVGALQLAYDC